VRHWPSSPSISYTTPAAMPLCENRHDIPGSPSSCVLDTVLVPLPSFVITIVLCYVLFDLHFAAKNGRLERNRLLKEWSGLPSWANITYLVLIAATFAMRILEIVRLILAHLGVGLLPIGLVALVPVFAAVWNCREGTGRGRRRGIFISTALLAYWLTSTIFELIKVIRLGSLDSLHLPAFAKGTMYPSSDWLLDNAVMLGLYIVFAIYEGISLFGAWRAPKPSVWAEKKNALMSDVA